MDETFRNAYDRGLFWFYVVHWDLSELGCKMEDYNITLLYWEIEAMSPPISLL